LRGLRHFESAIRLGASGSDVHLLSQARANEQFAQIGLKVPEHRGTSVSQKPDDAHITFVAGPALRKPPISAELFFSEIDGDRARSLEEMRCSMDQLSMAGASADIAWVSGEHRGKEFFFTHFSGDYIPGKMAEKRQFYESPYLNLLARLHQPGKLIVDGGANIGNHTVFFAGVIGAQVIAFEPQPFNYAFLIANVHLNRLESKVDIRKIAVGEKSGRISLVQALSGNHGSYTSDTELVKCNNGETHPPPAFDADVSTLDTELAHYANIISIIKLDLEGMELDCLQGARNIIARSLPVIAVECFTHSMYEKIKKFLSDLEYFVIDSTNATPTFIFLTRKNPRHMETLSKYLEMSSIGKFGANSAFNERKL
jgi:FkbM family methyltransferase